MQGLNKPKFGVTFFQGVPHSKLFDHMAFDHNFSVGQPDNLVYVNELLNQLEEQLDKMVSNILNVLMLYSLPLYTQVIIK